MESVSDPNATDTALRWFKVAGKILHYISLPFVQLLLLLVYILRVLLSPFIYIGNAFVRLCLIPYNILAKFEPVWYFLGCAVLIGLVSALVVHGILRTFVLVFKLDRKREPKARDVPATGHDVKSYRKARDKKRRQVEKEQREVEVRARALASSPLIRDTLKSIQRDEKERDMVSPRVRRPDQSASLLDQTILEQTDEEDS